MRRFIFHVADDADVSPGTFGDLFASGEYKMLKGEELSLSDKVDVLTKKADETKGLLFGLMSQKKKAKA